MDRNDKDQGWPSAGLCKSKNEAASVGGQFLVANVAYWHVCDIPMDPENVCLSG